MLDHDKLLNLLNQHAASGVSGAVLGDALGVSRVTVQKRIQALTDNGLLISAVPGVGYLLPEGTSLLNERDLRANLTQAAVSTIEVLQQVDSTNSRLLASPIAQGQVSLCVAESQVAGRGRRGNQWRSAPYRNVMMSISWGFPNWPETITGLGLAVALVVCENLRKRFAIDVQIKWPNDLLINDCKLAGVLIDVAGEASSACNVVIGIGLNVHQPDWSTDADYAWQDLFGLGVTCDRNILIAGLVDDLVSMLQEFEQNGFESFMTPWNELSNYAGKRIRVIASNRTIEGVMHGVDSMGALLVADDAGDLQRFVDSNVSVRPV